MTPITSTPANELKPSSTSIASTTSPTQTHHDTNLTSNPNNDTREDPTEITYNPRSPAFWLVVLAVYLAFFLIALDRMIIATAIPNITNTFDSISDIGWYGSAYMLTCAIFNPLFGNIYRLYPIKWVFVSSVVIFEAGSALCGAAPTSIALIVGRAIAGIGAAGISSGAIMIVINMVPLHKRPVFTSFFGMAFGVSSVVGPIVGGTFADTPHLTWRWCFYINLPIGACTILIILLFLRFPENSVQTPRAGLSLFQQLKRLDPLGVFFFAPSMVSLLLAMQWGGTTYAWSSPRIIGLLVTFAVTFVAFLAVEFTMPETAMAPARVVLHRSVGACLFFTFMLAGGMMCAVYYLSIWFQAAQGQSAMQAGIRTIPMVLSLVVCGIFSAAITQRIGYYVPALLVSPILSSIAAGLLSTLTPASGKGAWIGYQILYGFGVGAAMQQANLAAQTCLARHDVPLAMGLSFFMQQLGGALFLSVGQNLFSNQLVKQLSGIAGLDTHVIINTGATDLKKIVPANVLSTVVNAYSYALTRVFVLSAALSAAMILGSVCVEWKSIKKAKPAAKDAAAVDEEKGDKILEK